MQLVQLALLSCWAPVKSLAVTCVLADELGKGGRGKVGKEKRREGTGVSESISEASWKWPAVY